MEFEKIVQEVSDLKWLTPEKGKLLYQLVIENNIDDILELGFYHGVSAMYMAGAMQEKRSQGKIITIDKKESKELNPSIDELATRLNLDDYITPVYTHQCYTWELMKMLEASPRKQFDLVFIDGAHLWKTDGLAFFLCNKLLKTGGWMVFDDLSWSMSKHAHTENNEWVNKYTRDEQDTPHIRKVFDLLVKEHPDYTDFREENEFGFARKIKEHMPNKIKESVIVKPVMVTREMMGSLLKNKQK